MPTHSDNLSIVRERIYLDQEGLLRDQVTLIDHAFTRPWTVLKTYRRDPAKFPLWRDENCPAVTAMIKVGKELYYRHADGFIMPTRKDQPPPDLKYFNPRQRQTQR
jgi:hypothetical protein